MTSYTIDVTRIEELQTIKDLDSLEHIFTRAKSTIVNGESVILVRSKGGKNPEKFDEMTTLEELETYRDSVFKYL
jgi:hypothetical protein